MISVNLVPRSTPTSGYLETTINMNLKCKGNQNTFSLEWRVHEMNFQTEAYAPKLDHRPNNNNEKREYWKREFGEFEGFLYRSKMEYGRMNVCDKGKNIGIKWFLKGILNEFEGGK